MSIFTPRGPRPAEPEVELSPHEQEELDALIREARRRARRRRAGYAAGMGLAALIAGVLYASVSSGGTRSPVTPRGGSVRAAKTSVGRQPELDPQSVSFVSPSTGWVWGPGSRWLADGSGPGVLERTDDGGRDWRVMPTPGIAYAPPSAYPAGWASGVRFADRQHGYLFGGELYATGDGGRHWVEIRPPNRILDLEVGGGRAYAVIAGCRGLAACTEAYLYRLGNGGRKFIRIGPISPIGQARMVVQGRSVYLLAPPPAYRDVTPIPLWVSANAGRSWQRRSTPCHGEVEWDALAAWSTFGLALACGSEPGAGNQVKAFYVSTDGGSHWRFAGRVSGSPGLGGMSPGYVASLAAASQNTWALGEGRGTMLVTHDGGRSWRLATFAGRQAQVEGWGYISFVDARDGVGVPWTLNGSVIALTSDAGRRWSEVRFPSLRAG